MIHPLSHGDLYWIIFAFLVKHFLADFPLQTPFMLQKGNAGNWVWPLTVHCIVHAVLSLLIIAPYLSLFPTHDHLPGSTVLLNGGALGLVALEALAHWSIDYLKARVFVYQMNQSAFWVSLGADQLLHYLTYFAMIIFIIQVNGVAA